MDPTMNFPGGSGVRSQALVNRSGGLSGLCKAARIGENPATYADRGGDVRWTGIPRVGNFPASIGACMVYNLSGSRRRQPAAGC